MMSKSLNPSNGRRKYLKFIAKIPPHIRQKIKKDIGVPLVAVMDLRNFCLVYLYVFEKMSTFEIEEKYKDFFISKRGPLKHSGIRDVLKKYKVVRSRKASLRLRIRTGRMDYSKRVIDYRSRNLTWGYRSRGIILPPRARKKDVKTTSQLRQQLLRKGYRWLAHVKERIEKKGLTIPDMAKVTKIDARRLKMYINQSMMVDPRYQKKIAGYFGLDPKKIFRQDKDK